MDFGTSLKHLAPFMVPLLALCIPIVAIIATSMARTRRNAQMHQTVRLMVERGQAVPPEMLQALIEDAAGEKKPKAWSPANQLRMALINVAVGLALMLFLGQLPDAQNSVWLVGCIPLFIGLALLLAWYVESKQLNSRRLP